MVEYHVQGCRVGGGAEIRARPLTAEPTLTLVLVQCCLLQNSYFKRLYLLQLCPKHFRISLLHLFSEYVAKSLTILSDGEAPSFKMRIVNNDYITGTLAGRNRFTLTMTLQVKN